jgi:hypothetical protein
MGARGLAWVAAAERSKMGREKKYAHAGAGALAAGQHGRRRLELHVHVWMMGEAGGALGVVWETAIMYCTSRLASAHELGSISHTMLEACDPTSCATL